MGGLLKKRRRKRGGRKGKPKEVSLNIISTNAAGLKFKGQSLKNEIKSLNAAIFTVQETHFAKKGKIPTGWF